MYNTKYGNKQKQKAYGNAIQAIYNGNNYNTWNNCGLEYYEAAEVWDRALSDIGRIIGGYSSTVYELLIEGKLEVYYGI